MVQRVVDGWHLANEPGSSTFPVVDPWIETDRALHHAQVASGLESQHDANDTNLVEPPEENVVVPPAAWLAVPVVTRNSGNLFDVLDVANDVVDEEAAVHLVVLVLGIELLRRVGATCHAQCHDDTEHCKCSSAS